MKVIIISPEKTLYESECNLLQLPGVEGSFEILKNHAPIVSALGKGTIRIVENNNNEQLFEINGGIAECKSNEIKILVQ